MERPAEAIKRQDRRLAADAERAFATLKLHPDYPAVHLRVVEKCESLDKTIGSNLPKMALPSQERLDYAIALLDAQAGEYVALVRTLEEQECYARFLQYLEREMWKIYSGIAEIEPFGPNPAMASIRARGLHWYKESLRLLIPNQPRKDRRGYRSEVRAWMKRRTIPSVERAARELGVSESTLKSIMSNRGEKRYGDDTLAAVLKKIGVDNGERDPTHQ
jgi:hypothetical protein